MIHVILDLASVTTGGSDTLWLIVSRARSEAHRLAGPGTTLSTLRYLLVRAQPREVDLGLTTPDLYLQCPSLPPSWSETLRS